MPRIRALWQAVSKFRHMHSSEGRLVGSMIPKKQANDDMTELKGSISKAEANPDPTVAFSRPPPLPPVIGPLVSLSLLDSWFKQDSSDD